MNSNLHYQLNFPPIRHKALALLLILVGAFLPLAAIMLDLSLWIAIVGLVIYIGSVVYCIIESIRLKSYLIIVTFLGILAIGVYFLLFLLGILR